MNAMNWRKNMIYKCENCSNRHNCPENKEQYQNLCNLLTTVVKEADKMPDYHCYFSFTLKCDYFVEDKETMERDCEST